MVFVDQVYQAQSAQKAFVEMELVMKVTLCQEYRQIPMGLKNLGVVGVEAASEERLAALQREFQAATDQPAGFPVPALAQLQEPVRHDALQVLELRRHFQEGYSLR